MLETRRERVRFLTTEYTEKAREEQGVKLKRCNALFSSLFHASVSSVVEIVSQPLKPCEIGGTTYRRPPAC